MLCYHSQSLPQGAPSSPAITNILLSGFGQEVADRIVFMEGGYIVEEGFPDEIIYHPQEPRTVDFLSKVL